MKAFLSGNEAIAMGAFESGVLFAAGYPGTPSTEILEEIAKFNGIDAQWSVNEKVALDVAVGASLGGRRSLVAMKHVGLNVAADTLMTISYTGVNAGLILVTADDPGMHSSQNEQDNRNYAKFAKIPLLEPSDSQEAMDYTRLAFQISERFDTPVLIRITTRIAHSRGIVEIIRLHKKSYSQRSYVSNPDKYVMVPTNARIRRAFIEQRLMMLREFSEKFSCNRIEWNKKNLGVVTSGITYQYAKEACPQASFLKLGMTYPLPELLIKRFARKFPFLYVIEELDPFLEEQIKAMGIPVKGKELFSSIGELNPGLVRERLFNRTPGRIGSTPKQLLPRAPALCAGCSYLGLFYVLKKLNAIVIGDIGCYALSVSLPVPLMDTCISMGSSIGIALGLRKSLKQNLKDKVIAVIGDSTFIHSGITALIDVIYNKGANTVIILDNQTTAMTGGQDHPGTGFTLRKEKTSKFNYVRLAKGLGIKKIRIVDCYNLKRSKEVISKEMGCNLPSVVIAKNPCRLAVKRKCGFFYILGSRCVGCKECLNLGCSAILIDAFRKPYIDSNICRGCSLCQQVCPANAIKKKSDE